jgi:hypothetical protein
MTTTSFDVLEMLSVLLDIFHLVSCLLDDAKIASIYFFLGFCRDEYASPAS